MIGKRYVPKFRILEDILEKCISRMLYQSGRIFKFRGHLGKTI